MQHLDEKHAKILKRKALNKKILKYGCLPIGLLFVLFMVILFIAISDDSKEEVATNSLSDLIGVTLNDSIVLSYGSYDEIDCSSWPSRFRVYSFQAVPISFVVDLNSDRIVEADSAELKACAFVDLIRNTVVNNQFDSNGHHESLMTLVKNSMHDPSSFDPADTRYAEFTEDDKLNLFVYMKYRGNNTFGAKVINEIAVTTDLNGTILNIFEGDDIAWAAKKYNAQ